MRDGGLIASVVNETKLKVNVEKELVLQAEEEDMEALLGTYALFFFILNGIKVRLQIRLQLRRCHSQPRSLETWSNPFHDASSNGSHNATPTATTHFLMTAIKVGRNKAVDKNINPLIGFTGRLEKKKGSDILAEAIPQFMKENVQLVALIGPDRVAVEIASTAQIPSDLGVSALHRRVSAAQIPADLGAFGAFSAACSSGSPSPSSGSTATLQIVPDPVGCWRFGTSRAACSTAFPSASPRRDLVGAGPPAL
ncbi:hypothetical protein VNO78_23312 [Psophocarpus tetragonolobus]|uniref:Uncharacterized protein n=1 Tax=Psophocarpus tetragonolobus TaxID=3891 RepID=A0AAN9S4P4_PSOTE